MNRELAALCRGKTPLSSSSSSLLLLSSSSRSCQPELNAMDNMKTVWLTLLKHSSFWKPLISLPGEYWQSMCVVFLAPHHRYGSHDHTSSRRSSAASETPPPLPSSSSSTTTITTTTSASQDLSRYPFETRQFLHHHHPSSAMSQIRRRPKPILTQGWFWISTAVSLSYRINDWFTD